MVNNYVGFRSSDGSMIVVSAMLITQSYSAPDLPYTLESAKQAIPEFDESATYFVWGDFTKQKVLDIGFTNVLDFRDFADNERIDFLDGSYLLFKNRPYISDPTVYEYGCAYYDQNGIEIPRISIGGRSDNSTNAYTLVSPVPMEEGQRYRYAGIYINPLVDLPIFNLLNGKFPLITESTGATVNFWENIEPVDDPYAIDGISGAGGGTGTFSGTGDAIAIPALPSLSSVATGFITLYNPNITQLRNLASYLWSDLFDLDTFRKLFADPMQAVLGLSIVPVDVPNLGEREVKFGNVSTGVSMMRAASQYVAVDCGTLNLAEFWGAYLDYDPYTKVDIYLPYIGIRPLSADLVMGKSIHVVYHVDILSGACVAYVSVGGTILYSFIGQCSASIPITGDNWTNVINGALNIAGAIGTMVATGGASAPMGVGTIASTAVNGLKPSIEKSGGMSGMGGMLAVQTPYLIVTRPRQALPANQNAFSGYPSFITETLGTLSGYTEIDSIHLENVPATSDELSEIENLLKGGVIL